jgi:periplasmic protein TonB
LEFLWTARECGAGRNRSIIPEAGLKRGLPQRFKVTPRAEGEFERAALTVRRSKTDFEARTRSQAFHAEHAKAGNSTALGFESVLELQPKGQAAQRIDRMVRKVAVRRLEAEDDGKVVFFPVRPARERNAPAVDLTERAHIAQAPTIENSQRPTLAPSPVPRWLRVGIVASLAIHLALFAALEWRFVNDLERAAGASAAAAAEGTIVIPVEVVIQAALPSALSPTNATVPTAKAVETPNPTPQRQANIPELEKPAPVVVDIPVPTQTPKPALPVEQNAKPQKVETKETPQAPARLVIEPRTEVVKQQQKRKQLQAAPSAAATPNPAAAGARGAGQAGAGGQSQAGGTASISSYQALVLAHLQRHRVYPPEARDRSITGVAAVRFALASNGSVISAGLARSSGESILDSAAVDMVRRASPFPPFPPGMGRARLDFAAPIRFDLR